MCERRDAQFPKFKSLRDQYRYDKNIRVRLTKDKLYVNNTLIPGDFEENPLPATHSSLPTQVRYNNMIHTQVVEESGSYFQGHLKSINSLSEAAAAHSALLQDRDVARAHHIPYAYCVTLPTGVATGYSDDGEIGAGRILKSLIEENSLQNIFLGLSRRHEGPNLGRKRFDLVRSTALEAIHRYN